MQAVGPSGFYNVPVTKFLMLFIGSCSLLASILNYKQIFHLQLSPHITIHHQFWRLVTSHCAFTNSGELFFGLLLLYSMRVIERQFGSPKYAAFMFVTLLIATFLEIGALVSGARLGFRKIPGGPYAIIFSALYQYHRMIPVTYRFRIFGITFNDKIFVFIPAVQMMLSQYFSTLVPAVCGLLVGALYRSDVGNIKQWRFPRIIRSWTSRLIGSSLASGPIPRSSTTMPNETTGDTTAINNLMTSAATGLRNRRQNNNNPPTSTTTTTTTNRSSVDGVREYIDTFTGRSSNPDLEPPSEQHTSVLMTMFPDHPREVIIRAVTSSRNDLNRAVEIMLSTPAPNTGGAGSSSSTT
ncbi:hypothetical protein LRAMOSA05532 [Lichtheimia ramosa]|uniref:CUE domain-containing protein n=1 Tax=Lichtheimia ramosa TaxID=688394 RepID=A0A077X1I0_9FUNG|nr:hypothetical protein LRAMOSA05532 [Lichtheimia ramosa]